MRTIHDLQQGTPEWHAHREKHYNASDAAAALGVSPYKSRTQLIREIATGITPEIDEATQRRFDDGHRFEDMARPWAEEIIGEELFRCTASLKINGLPLSASFDGHTMDETIIWEHKSLNAELDAALAENVIPAHYRPQLEQQLLILDAQKCLFMASNGSRETMRFAWYESDPALRAKLIAAWKQLRDDVPNYQPQEVIPAAVAAPIEDLPALAIEITGSVVASNLTQWRDIVTTRIAEISTDLQTDTDFATAEKTVKFLDDGEKRIDLVKSQAQAQAADIDAVFRALDEIKASMRTKRLELDRLVKARKETIRAEILQKGKDALVAHIAALNQQIGQPFMPAVPADFAGVMKGKKTLASLRDAVDTELARAKILANEISGRIQFNLNALAKLVRQDNADYGFLVRDVAQLVLRDADAVEAIVKSRIAEHKAAEDKRLEDERQKIRAEEQAKAEAEARSKLEAERPVYAPLAAAQSEPIAPAPAQQAVQAPSGGQPQEASVTTMKLGEINTRLSPLSITADGLTQLGFRPAGKERAAVLYREADFPAICAALVRHIDEAQRRAHDEA